MKCLDKRPARYAGDDTGALLLTLIIASDQRRPVLLPGRRPSPPARTVGTLHNGPVEIVVAFEEKSKSYR